MKGSRNWCIGVSVVAVIAAVTTFSIPLYAGGDVKSAETGASGQSAVRLSHDAASGLRPAATPFARGDALGGAEGLKQSLTDTLGGEPGSVPFGLARPESDGEATAVPHGGSGLRLDYPDVLLLSALDPKFPARFTSASSCDRAVGFWPGDFEAPAGQAYQVEKIIILFSRITTIGLDTYLRIDFGLPGGAGFAGSLPTDLLIDPVEATVIVNTGADTNGVCDMPLPNYDFATENYDCWSIDLITGHATSIFDGTVYYNVVDYAKSSIPTGGNGAIPVGTGVSIRTMGARAGQWSAAQSDVIYGPLGDDCVKDEGVTGPGGLLWLNWISSGDDCPATIQLSGVAVGPDSEPGVGWGISGVFADYAPFGDSDRIWEDGEGWWCGSTVGPYLNVALDGSLGADCNTNGYVDGFDVNGGTSSDDNGNGVPDECELKDCQPNLVPDLCDIDCGSTVPPNPLGWTPGLCSDNYACGGSSDCNANAVPDECELADGNDCNANGKPDDCDLAGGTSPDCNDNNIPDECDVDPDDPDEDGDVWRDCDSDLIPDGCQRAIFDCNGNGVGDYCDIQQGNANDVNTNGIPDSCDFYDRTVTLHFEDVYGDLDYEYALGGDEGPQIDAQPTEEEAPAGYSFYADWQSTWGDFDPGIKSDVVSDSVSCFAPDAKLLQVDTLSTNGFLFATPAHIYLSDPDTEFISSLRAPYQEMTMTVEFDQASYGTDWDIIFTSYWDTGDNDYLLWLSLATNEDCTNEIQANALTGVEWNTAATRGRPVELKVVLDYLDPRVTALDLSYVGRVYWDGQFVAYFTPRMTSTMTGNIDSFQVQSYYNGCNQPNGYMQFDCITLRRGAELDWDDCNGNGMNDLWELGQGLVNDCNNDQVPDSCVDWCNDCNNNFIPDECDIQAGTSTDNNANELPDECDSDELTFGFDFEPTDYQIGLLEGQQGWIDFHARAGTYPILGEPGYDVAAAPAGMTGQALRIQPNSTNPNDYPGGYPPSDPADPDFATYYLRTGASALYELLPDRGVEDWSAKIRVDQAGAGLTGWNTFEIKDMCADSSWGPNAGIALTNEDAGGGTYRVYAWFKDASGNVSLDPGSGATWTPGQVEEVTVRIHNYDGGVEIFWNGSATPQWNKSQASEIANAPDPFGGDRQLLIRSHQYLSTAWFDDVTYSFDENCDRDAMLDSEYIDLKGGTGGIGGNADINNDRVPDRCQDCDNDCLDFKGYASGGAGCLDPAEAAGNDCNGNVIPDECDVNTAGLPYFGGSGDHYKTRYGGEFSDCNNNLDPDVCDFADEDCNENDIIDGCDILADPSLDVVPTGGNGVIDDCDPDCNNNDIPDWSDINAGTSDDQIINDDPSSPCGGFPLPPCDEVPDECCPNSYGADFDDDGDIDLVDFQRLQECAGTVAGKTFPDTARRACGCADLNEDGEVNGKDQRTFHFIMTGP